MPGEPFPLSFAFRSYLEAGAWRCGVDSPQAHYWVQVQGGEFKCKHCGEIKAFPVDWKSARKGGENRKDGWNRHGGWT